MSYMSEAQAVVPNLGEGTHMGSLVCIRGRGTLLIHNLWIFHGFIRLQICIPMSSLLLTTKNTMVLIGGLRLFENYLVF